MSYRLKIDEAIDDGVRRIAREQIDKARDEIADGDLDAHETVHQVRKRGKKLRGLLRLVRPALGSIYANENEVIRDAARALSNVRDATTVIESFDDLLARDDGVLDPGEIDDVRAELEERREQVARAEDLPQRLDAFDDEMRSLRDRVGEWSLEPAGLDDAERGLRRTYRRARRRLRDALRTPTTERLHEWRKRVKYHGHHVRLLREAWLPAMKCRIEDLDRLSDLLGDDHDLALLRATIVDGADRFGTAAVTVLPPVITVRRRELQAWTVPLGRRLLDEKPRRLALRLRGWWRCAEAERRLARMLTAPARSIPAGVA